MLRFFLRARAFAAGESAGIFYESVRRMAGLDRATFKCALRGTLRKAGPRAALWAVLGHFPADHGITLTDDGGQEP